MRLGLPKSLTSEELSQARHARIDIHNAQTLAGYKTDFALIEAGRSDKFSEEHCLRRISEYQHELLTVLLPRDPALCSAYQSARASGDAELAARGLR